MYCYLFIIHHKWNNRLLLYLHYGISCFGKMEWYWIRALDTFHIMYRFIIYMERLFCYRVYIKIVPSCHHLFLIMWIPKLGRAVSNKNGSLLTMSFLHMTWCYKEPGHQRKWYWPSSHLILPCLLRKGKFTLKYYLKLYKRSTGL